MLLAVIFVPIGMVVFGVTAKNEFGVAATTGYMTSIIVGYILARCGRAHAGVLIVIVLVTLLIYAEGIATSTVDKVHELASFPILILSAGAFLPVRLTLLVAAIQIALLFIYPSIVPAPDLNTMLSGTIFMHVALLLISLIFSAAHRLRYETFTNHLADSRQRYKLLAAEHSMQAQLLESILSASGDHIVVCDRESRIQYINHALLDHLQLKKPAVIGKQWQELDLYGQAASNFEKYVREIFAGHADIHVEEIDDRVGPPTHYAMTFRPIHAVNGEVVSAVATRRNITPYVQATRELEIAKERYRIISELMSDYAFSFRFSADGQPGELEWMTADSFQRVTGYTWQELIESGDIYILYHEDDRETVRFDMDVVNNGWTIENEYRIVTKSGEERWIRLYRRPEWNKEHTRVERYVGVARDITESRNTERQEFRLKAEREHLSVVQRFVRAVSHDFRNSLANIETSRYLIHRHAIEPTGNERLMVKSENIRRFIEHISEQLDNLNTIFALKKDHHPNVDIQSIMRALMTQMSKHAAAGDIQLHMNVNDDLPLINGSVQELTHAIRQLINNALNYTPEGGTVTLDTRLEGGSVHISVTDTGPGIKSEHLPKIFDLFFRADPARSMEIGGVGIGLSIVKLVADAHGGTVTVNSNEGGGSTFTLILPRVIQGPSDA